MHGQQSLNLELTPLDPDLERNLRRSLRTRVEMEKNQRNANMEEQEEYQDARAGNEEQRGLSHGFHYVTTGTFRTSCD
jgi:hypothetical protein